MRDKKQQLKLVTEQWVDSKLGKKYVKVVYCYPAYLTYLKSISCDMLGWMHHKLELRFQEKNINNLIETYDTMLMADSKKVPKSLLMKVKEDSEKPGFKCSIKKIKIVTSGFITSRSINWGEKNENTDYILGLQNHCRQ